MPFSRPSGKLLRKEQKNKRELNCYLVRTLSLDNVNEINVEVH